MESRVAVELLRTTKSPPEFKNHACLLADGFSLLLSTQFPECFPNPPPNLASRLKATLEGRSRPFWRKVRGINQTSHDDTIICMGALEFTVWRGTTFLPAPACHPLLQAVQPPWDLERNNVKWSLPAGVSTCWRRTCFWATSRSFPSAFHSERPRKKDRYRKCETNHPMKNVVQNHLSKSSQIQNPLFCCIYQTTHPKSIKILPKNLRQNAQELLHKNQHTQHNYQNYLKLHLRSANKKKKCFHIFHINPTKS